jgi:hypothetical protein
VTRVDFFRQEFVEHIPEQLSEGVLYTSIRYATVMHLCACGCGREVVTPLAPTDWEMIFDGETLSLSPSIGNWGFPCQSHYWIRRGSVRWSRWMSPEQVERLRERDRRRRRHYASLRKASTGDAAEPGAITDQQLIGSPPSMIDQATGA